MLQVRLRQTEILWDSWKSIAAAAAAARYAYYVLQTGPIENRVGNITDQVKAFSIEVLS